MDSIEERFKKIKNGNPFLSTYSCFYQAIVGRNYTPRAVSTNFNKCVDKTDYSKGDKQTILDQLQAVSKK